MKIEQPTDNSLYVTIGDYVYYFDDSIDGENIVARWHLDDDESDTKEDLQLDNKLIPTHQKHSVSKANECVGA
jgi:hypothetical protein